MGRDCMSDDIDPGLALCGRRSVCVMTGVSYDGHRWQGFDSDGRLLANSCAGCIAIYLARSLYKLQRTIHENQEKAPNLGSQKGIRARSTRAAITLGRHTRHARASVLRRFGYRTLCQSNSARAGDEQFAENARYCRRARLERSKVRQPNDGGNQNDR